MILLLSCNVFRLIIYAYSVPSGAHLSSTFLIVLTVLQTLLSIDVSLLSKCCAQIHILNKNDDKLIWEYNLITYVGWEFSEVQIQSKG